MGSIPVRVTKKGNVRTESSDVSFFASLVRGIEAFTKRQRRLCKGSDSHFLRGLDALVKNLSNHMWCSPFFDYPWRCQSNPSPQIVCNLCAKVPVSQSETILTFAIAHSPSFATQSLAVRVFFSRSRYSNKELFILLVITNSSAK